MERLILTTHPSESYELLDSGEEEKLERYGSIVLARPDPQALWRKTLSQEIWHAADGRFLREGGEGKWRVRPDFPKEWPVAMGGITFIIRPTSFKHTGLFPEQFPNWQWMGEIIKKARRPVSVLNLFGYTGGATLACAEAGASVVHVDASNTAVAWARENAAASGLAEKPIRWIVEDVLVFVRREIKRGNRYDAIVMDPPAFGHGPKDELWKIEEHFVGLVEACAQLLAPEPLFFLMSGYAAGYSSFAFAYNLEPLAKKCGGSIEHGDLSVAQQGSGRILPCGIFARWRA